MAHNPPRPSLRAKLSQLRGVSLVEFCIILPVLVTMLLVTFEMGRFLVKGYLPAATIAYEGVRAGIGIVGMQEACFDGRLKNLGSGQSTPPTNDDYTNYLALRRAYFIAEQYIGSLSLPIEYTYDPGGGSTPVVLPGVSIDGELIREDDTKLCGKGEDFKNTWSVRVCGTYVPAIFPRAFAAITFCAKSVGSLLSKQEMLESSGGSTSYSGGAGGGYSCGSYNSYGNGS